MRGALVLHRSSLTPRWLSGSYRSVAISFDDTVTCGGAGDTRWCWGRWQLLATRFSQNAAAPLPLLPIVPGHGPALQPPFNIIWRPDFSPRGRSCYVAVVFIVGYRLPHSRQWRAILGHAWAKPSRYVALPISVRRYGLVKAGLPVVR